MKRTREQQVENELAIMARILEEPATVDIQESLDLLDAINNLPASAIRGADLIERKEPLEIDRNEMECRV